MGLAKRESCLRVGRARPVMWQPRGMARKSTQARKERINKQLREEELARLGQVRLPWVAFPGMNPFRDQPRASRPTPKRPTT